MGRHRTFEIGVIVFGLVSFCRGQGQATTPSPWPAERGIITTFNNWYYEWESQIRHLPGYPGYEDIPGELDEGVFDADVQELRFPNPISYMQSLGVDYRDKSIYMYDYGLSTITMGTGYNRDLNVNFMEFYELHTAVSKRGIKIAVDWLSHVVYWTDAGFRWIAAAPGQIDKIDKGYYKIIVRSHLDEPTGLALDPIEGMLCWSDSGKHPKIECSDLMGRQRRTVASKYLKSPSSLAMDIFGKRIYWTDDSTDSVVSVTYSGDDSKTIARITRSTLFQMDLFRDILYVSNTYDGYIYVLNKTNGREVANPISISPYDAYGIAVYGDERQPLKETDHCLAKNCDHFCITEKYGATCVCSEGFVLDTRNGKCQAYDAGFHKAIVIANATDICLHDIRSFVETGFVPRCIFTVIKQKQVTSTVPPGRKKRQVSSSTEANANSTVRLNTSPTTAKPTTAKPTTAKPTTTTTTMAPSTTPIVPPGDYIKEFDMDMKNRIIFFATADNAIYKRAIDLTIENDGKELIVKAAGNITGLAYDAEDPNNLYWCESDTGHVWVVNTVSRSSTKVTLDATGIKNVTDIIVLLNQRKLAMIAGAYPDMSIQTMTMDGQDFNVVVSGKSDISAFTYDSEKQLIYYISSRRMYTTSIDGSDGDVLFQGVDPNVLSLVLYQHYLTWVYRNSTGLGQKTHFLLDDSSDEHFLGNTSLVDMKILDTKLQESDHISPCAKDNGGCSHICVTKYVNNVMSPICECSLGYTLENNLVNCTTRVVEDDFVLVADWTNEEILQISLATDEVNVIPGEESAEYMGVFFDPEKKKVIFGQYYDSKIYSANLNGTDHRILADLGSDGYPYRFTIDTTSGNMYFSAYYSTFVGVFTPLGDYVVLNDDFGWDSLNGIAVHPKKGWMYYAVAGWTALYIGRSNMDGTDPVKLIRVNGGYPDGITIDYTNDHLFWSDSEHDTIQQCNLDGLDCVTIVNMTGTGHAEEIRDMETDGVYLYYSTYRKDYVVRVELTKPYKREIIGRNYGLGRLDTMAFYSSKNKNIQPVYESCRARNGLGDCSTICLPSSLGRTCACATGVSLKPDGRTCSNIYQCTDVIYQPLKTSSGVEATIDVTMNRSCSRYIDNKCNYKCPANYEPNFDTLLICTKAGWNLEPNALCKEIKCAISIDNGKLVDTCTRVLGEECDFECDKGFVKTRDTAVCTKNGTFSVPNGALCTPFKCSDTIDHGSLDKKCQRTIGTKCQYTCDNFYSPSVTTSMVTCSGTGWSPASTNLCEESTCEDNSLQDGSVTKDCQKKIGNACMFQCSQGYVNKSSMVVCKSDRKWHPADSCKQYTCSNTIENGLLDQNCTRTVGSSCNYTCNKYYIPNASPKQATCGADGWRPASADLCQHIKCPLAIPNGELTGDCDLTIGSTCNFKCNSGFTPSDSHPNVTCTFYGKWFTDNLCLVPPPEKFQLSVPGVVSGFIILVVIVSILVVVVVYMVRRKRLSTNYAEFGNNVRGGSISLGNPGYGLDDQSMTTSS